MVLVGIIKCPQNLQIYSWCIFFSPCRCKLVFGVFPVVVSKVWSSEELRAQTLSRHPVVCLAITFSQFDRFKVRHQANTWKKWGATCSANALPERASGRYCALMQPRGLQVWSSQLSLIFRLSLALWGWSSCPIADLTLSEYDFRSYLSCVDSEGRGYRAQVRSPTAFKCHRSHECLQFHFRLRCLTVTCGWSYWRDSHPTLFLYHWKCDIRK